MTSHHPRPPQPDERGAATVADLGALPEPQGIAVLLLRDWCSGTDGQARVWSVISGSLGAAAGRAALRDFEELVGLCCRHGRRPMMCHATSCRCVGADEAVFAHFVALAAAGEREEAMLMATLMVRADVAPLAVPLAERAGLALHRAVLRMRAHARASRIGSATLH